MKVLKNLLILISFNLYYAILFITFLISICNFVGGFFLVFVLPVVIVVLPFVVKVLIKKGIYISIIFSYMVLFFYTSLMVTFNHYAILERKEFSIVKWNSPKYCGYRTYMVDDLRCKYSFVGMTREEVDSILGSIDVSNCKYDLKKDNKICFFLRSDSYSVLEYFCLYFGDNNIVTEAKVELEEPTINYDKLELYK